MVGISCNWSKEIEVKSFLNCSNRVIKIRLCMEEGEDIVDDDAIIRVGNIIVIVKGLVFYEESHCYF